MKLIKNWEELAQVPANDKYKIIVDSDCCCGWIVPICDEPSEINDFDCHCVDSCLINFFDDHVYLSTHTFYGSHYKESTELLQKFGFDIELENWDKEVKNGNRRII